MFNQFRSTWVPPQPFSPDADPSMHDPGAAQGTVPPDGAQAEDSDDPFDRNIAQERAFLSELHARQQKDQARLLAGFRQRMAGQHPPAVPPTQHKQAQQAQQQLHHAQQQLQQAQRQLQQAFQQVQQLQQQLCSYAPWTAPDPWAAPGPWTSDQWAAPNRWTPFNPYGCGSFAPTFRHAYTSPFVPSCSPYGMSFADRCAFSPFHPCGSSLQSGLAGLAGLVGFELGAALF